MNRSGGLTCALRPHSHSRHFPRPGGSAGRRSRRGRRFSDWFDAQIAPAKPKCAERRCSTCPGLMGDGGAGAPQWGKTNPKIGNFRSIWQFLESCVTIGHCHGRKDWPYRTPTMKPTNLFSGRSGTMGVLCDVYGSWMGIQEFAFTAELLLVMMRPDWFLYDRRKCDFKEEQPKKENTAVDHWGRNVAWWVIDVKRACSVSCRFCFET